MNQWRTTSMWRDEVTSTGINTFGLGMDEMHTGYEEIGRPPRRLTVVAVFAALSMIGAAGCYFAVVSGLGSLLRGEPAAAPRHQTVVAESPAPAKVERRAPRHAVQKHPPHPPVQKKTPHPAVQKKAPAKPRAIITELAGAPPVPTPTAPSPSGTGPPSPPGTPSHPIEEDPSDSPDPSGATHDGHMKVEKEHP